MNLKHLIFFLCMLGYMTGNAQRVNTKRECVKLKLLKDDRIIFFENDSITLEFSAKEVADYLAIDLKKSKWQIREYDGKKKLMESLNKSSENIHVKIKTEFSTEKVKGDVPSAMLTIAYDLLKVGHVRIKEVNKVYKTIIYQYTNGPYGNKTASFIASNKTFFNYIIALGE